MADKESNKELAKGKELLRDINRLRKELNQDPLVFADNLEDNLKNLPGILKDTRDRLRESAGSMSDLYSRLRAVTSELKGQAKPLTEIRRAYRSITDDVNKVRQDELGITKLNLKALQGIKKRVKLNKALIDDESVRLLNSQDGDAKELDAYSKINAAIKAQTKDGKTLADLDEKSRNFISEVVRDQEGLSDEKKALIGTYVTENDLVKDINNKIEKRLESEKELVKMYENFTIAKDAFSSIPLLGPILSKPFAAGEAAAMKMADETDNAAEVSKAGIDAIGGSFTKMFTTPLGQLALLAAAFSFVKKIAFAVNEEVVGIGKSMAISYEEAQDFRHELWKSSTFSGDLVQTTKSLLKAQTALAAKAGATRGFKEEELVAQARLVGRMGMQEKSAAKLANMGRTSKVNAEDALDSIISSTQALFKQEGVQLNIQDVTEEVANTSGQLAANLEHNPTLIGQAVVQARRMGLELSKTKDISESLLDFESSIASELEAEILLGKQFNFEKARALSLQGDYVGATQELVRQVGTLDDFQKLNVIQQNALAKAVGMSSDEMADMLKQQKNLTLLGKEAKQQIQDKVKQLIDEGKTEEANNLLRNSGSDEQAKAALMQLTASQQLAMAVEKVNSIISVLGNNLGLVGAVLGVIAGLMAAIAISAIIASGGLALVGAGIAMAGLGIAGGIAGASLSSGTDGGADPKVKPNAKAQDFVLQTDKKDSFSLVGGTSLTSNDKYIKKMSMDMGSLLDEMKRSAVLKVDSTSVVQKAIEITYK